MNDGLKTHLHEGRISTLENLAAQLNAGLQSKAPAVGVQPQPQPLPNGPQNARAEVSVDVTSLKTSLPLDTKSSSKKSEGTSAEPKIRLWVVYQSALQEIEVSGSLI